MWGRKTTQISMQHASLSTTLVCSSRSSSTYKLDKEAYFSRTDYTRRLLLYSTDYLTAMSKTLASLGHTNHWSVCWFPPLFARIVQPVPPSFMRGNDGDYSVQWLVMIATIPSVRALGGKKATNPFSSPSSPASFQTLALRSSADGPVWMRSRCVVDGSQARQASKGAGLREVEFYSKV
jgi:hypothetical protein